MSSCFALIDVGLPHAESFSIVWLIRPSTPSQRHTRCSQAGGFSGLVPGGVKCISRNSDNIGIENTDLKPTARGYIETDDRLRTPVEGVYAMGDIAGRYMFTHAANFESEWSLPETPTNCYFETAGRTRSESHIDQPHGTGALRGLLGRSCKLARAMRTANPFVARRLFHDTLCRDPGARIRPQPIV
jgi:hypothetical protein